MAIAHRHRLLAGTVEPHVAETVEMQAEDAGGFLGAGAQRRQACLVASAWACLAVSAAICQLSCATARPRCCSLPTRVSRATPTLPLNVSVWLACQSCRVAGREVSRGQTE